MKNICIFLLMFFSIAVAAQVDTTNTDEEDWDIYGDFEVADDKPVRLWADAKIVGLSPQRFVGLGWDMHMGYPMMLSRDENGENPAFEPNANYTGGLRFTSNIPVISRTSFIWQSGINYSDYRYAISDIPDNDPLLPISPIIRPVEVANALNENGVRVLNWINTFYKPLSGNSFLLVQTQFDMAGDFGLELQSLKYLRYSGAVLWGKRPSDYEQWAVGVSRTYRVGALNYIPIVLYNWTSRSKTWGLEALAPARVHGRYNFSPRSLLLFGYELDGASHRFNNISERYGSGNSIELRRGEIKARIDYQFQVSGFFWASIQAGYRINYSFHIDALASGEDDFTRAFGLNSNAPDFWMNNGIGNTPYFHVSLNFVSP
jgi:hypothetical protein